MIDLKKLAMLSALAFSLSAYASIKMSFPKDSKLTKAEQEQVIEELKKQCPYITREDMIANSYSEVEKDGVLIYKFTVQIPRGEDGDFDLTITWDKGVVKIESEGDYCLK